MSGHVMHCFEKRTYDLGIGSGDQEIVIADEVDLSAWSEATFMVRVHDHSLAGHLNSIMIGAYAQSLSAQDPGLTFIDNTPIASTLINPGTPVGAFLTFAEIAGSEKRPPMARVFLRVTRTDSGSVGATISLDVSVKDA